MQEVNNMSRKNAPLTTADYALDFEGVSGSKTFINTGKKTITTGLINGGPLITNAQKVNGNTSGIFGSTAGDCLSMNPAAAVWPGDFTIETWINQNGPGPTLYSANFQMVASFGRLLTDLVYCFCLYEGKLAFKTVNASAGVGTIIAGATPIKTNVWEHVAMVRKAGMLSLWVNGRFDSPGQVSWGDSFSSPYAFYIGNAHDQRVAGTGGYCGLNGYMDRFRIYGKAIYDSPFTPSRT